MTSSRERPASSEAALAARRLRIPPDPGLLASTEATVRAAIADGSFLEAADLPVLDTALERYREHGLAGLLAPLVDRIGSLTALNGPVGAEFARRRGGIAVAENPSPYFVAGTANYADGSALILFDSGLFHTLWEVAMAVCALLPVRAGRPPSIATGEVTAVLALHQAGCRVLGGSRYGTQLVLPPGTGRAGALLLDGAQLFVLAHEVSHVLLGHGRRPTDADEDGAVVGSGEADELAADVLAFHIVTEDVRRAGPDARFSDSLYRVAGARLVFECIEMTERLAYVLPARTHPPARRRWGVVRDFARAGFGPEVLNRMEDLWIPYDAAASELAGGSMSITTLVADYERLVDRGGLLGAALPPGHLRALLGHHRVCDADRRELRNPVDGWLRAGSRGRADLDVFERSVLAAVVGGAPRRGLTWAQLHRAVAGWVGTNAAHREWAPDETWAATSVVGHRLRDSVPPPP